MKTCREIATSALVKAHQTALGATPAPEEAEAALGALQSIYDEFVSGGAFGRLENVLIDAAYEAGENERITSDGGPFTVTLPTTVDDDVTGDPRSPRDYALVVKADTSAAYLYSAPTAAWQTLTGLTLDSNAPLSERSADGLSCFLAARLAGDFNAEVSAHTIASAGRFLSLITMKADAPRTETATDYF